MDQTKLRQAINHLVLCLSDERATPSDSPGFRYKREETDRAIQEVKIAAEFYRQ